MVNYHSDRIEWVLKPDGKAVFGTYDSVSS